MKTKSTEYNLVIFTDGACSGNPGPGGWGAVIAWPEGKIKEIGGGQPATTNNQMELLAGIEALREVAAYSGPIDFYTDSTYVIRGITQWIWGWKKRGWKNAEGQDVLNRDYWMELGRLVASRGSVGKINWKYSRGHVGTPGNERCDEIAVSFSKRRWIDLYEGSLLQYPIAIYDFPENSELPEMRPKEVKKAAYSYLSVLGGVVVRHRDWASCERRVKGQSGAKFKKALSADDEGQILKAWGLAAGTQIREN
jgi:ribonuclease HI